MTFLYCTQFPRKYVTKSNLQTHIRTGYHGCVIHGAEKTKIQLYSTAFLILSSRERTLFTCLLPPPFQTPLPLEPASESVRVGYQVEEWIPSTECQAFSPVVPTGSPPPHHPLEQSCWRNEGSMNRGMDQGRGLGIDELLFLIQAQTSNSTRYFKFHKNSNSISPSSFPKSNSNARSISRNIHTPPPP